MMAVAPSKRRSRWRSRKAGWPDRTRSPSHIPSRRTKPASNTDTTARSRGTSSPLTQIRMRSLRASSSKSCVPWAMMGKRTDAAASVGLRAPAEPVRAPPGLANPEGGPVSRRQHRAGDRHYHPAVRRIADRQSELEAGHVDGEAAVGRPGVGRVLTEELQL